MVVAELRVTHAQRRKDIFSREFTQRFAAHALYDDGQQEKSRVAVEPVVSGSKVQRFLPHDERQRVLVRGHAVGVDSRELHEREVIAQSAGVVQQVQDCNFLSIVGEFRNVFPHIIVRGELSLLFKEQNARRSELLRSGADIKYAGGCDRNIFLQVREAVALGVNDGSAAITTQRTSGRARLRQVGENLVYCGGGLIAGTIRACRAACAEGRAKGCERAHYFFL